MKNEVQHIEELKSAVAKRFARTLDAPTDYDALSLDIVSVTGESVSVSTLKRLFGYDKHSTTPRPSTLSTLSRYVGYAGWSDFCERRKIPEELKPKSRKRITHKLSLPIILIIVAVVAVMIISTFVLTKESDTLHTKPTAEDIRNKWVQLSMQKCDSIRSYRKEMEVVEYSKVIDNFYFAFVFEQAKQGIAEDIDTLEDLSAEEKTALQVEIATSCQNICVELMREIADELNIIHNRKK